ncbi:MAG TPA: MraY family glycosyltransferase, partial [Egibacteraceae bacterium]|nr:MraY family glycosyltransferase [Egibacteraceae bacterium]
MVEYLHHLAVFVVALVTCLAATPVVRRVAVALGAVAEPGERHVHTDPTPTLGGLALFAGVLAAIAAASRLSTFDEVFRTTSEPEAVVLAGLVVVAVGARDDLRGVSAPGKLAAQVLAAGMLVLLGGVYLRWIYIPGLLPGSNGNIVVLGFDLAALLTVVAIVAMINAVNLVDGLDGLAAGIVVIAALALFSYVQLSDAWARDLPSSAPMLLAAVAGACGGFLFHNFHPASIFMGDTGAMLLGLVLGAGGVSAISWTAAPNQGDFVAISIPVLVPALVLAVPFVDTIWTILRRLRSGRAVFSPDKEHLHHRLLEIGNSHRRAVLIMYYWSALLAFGAVAAGLVPRAVL